MNGEMETNLRRVWGKYDKNTLSSQRIKVLFKNAQCKTNGSLYASFTHKKAKPTKQTKTLASYLSVFTPTKKSMSQVKTAVRRLRGGPQACDERKA